MDVYSLSTSKTLASDYKTRIQNFREVFDLLNNLSIINMTPKVHAIYRKLSFIVFLYFSMILICLDHLQWIMDETKETLYWRDMQGIENCHARMTIQDRAHNTKATHCKVSLCLNNVSFVKY